MGRLDPRLLLLLTLLATAAVVGFAVQGPIGILLWPGALLLCLLLFAFAWFVADCAITYVRVHARIDAIKARVRRLPTSQLQELIQTPAHADSRFARLELMRRGADARPSREQLSAMLTSGDPSLCGQAIVYLAIFYPKVRLPLGSSNHDSAELWRARVAELWEPSLVGER